MIGRMEIRFSKQQIVRAKNRLAFQMRIVERLHFGSQSRYTTRAEELLYLMEDRLAYLQKRHEALLAEQKASRETSATPTGLMPTELNNPDPHRTLIVEGALVADDCEACSAAGPPLRRRSR